MFYSVITFYSYDLYFKLLEQFCYTQVLLFLCDFSRNPNLQINKSKFKYSLFFEDKTKIKDNFRTKISFSRTPQFHNRLENNPEGNRRIFFLVCHSQIPPNGSGSYFILFLKNPTFNNLLKSIWAFWGVIQLKSVYLVCRNFVQLLFSFHNCLFQFKYCQYSELWNPLC